MKKINLIGQIVDGKKIVYQDIFREGFARVKNSDEEWNFIDKSGKFLSKIWFKYAEHFFEGFAIVGNENFLFNYIDKNGKLLRNDIWFVRAENFCEGFARVENEKGEWNFIDKKGNYLSEIWYKHAYDFSKGFASVKNEENKWNFIDKNGKLLSKIWFDDVTYFFDEFAFVKINENYYFIDKTAKLYYLTQKINGVHFELRSKSNNYYVYKDIINNKYVHLLKNYKYAKVFNTALTFEHAFPELVALKIKFNE